jgi:hypothetical protein
MATAGMHRHVDGALQDNIGRGDAMLSIGARYDGKGSGLGVHGALRCRMTTRKMITLLLADNRWTNQRLEWTNKTWTGDSQDELEQGGFTMTMTRRRSMEGHCQYLESSSAASGAYHRCAEEEEEVRKLVVLAMAMKWEEDAE